ILPCPGDRWAARRLMKRLVRWGCSSTGSAGEERAQVGEQGREGRVHALAEVGPDLARGADFARVGLEPGAAAERAREHGGQPGRAGVVHTRAARQQPVQPFDQASAPDQIPRSTGESAHISLSGRVLLGQLGVDDQLHHQVCHGACRALAYPDGARLRQRFAAQIDEGWRAVEERVGAMMQVDAGQELRVDDAGQRVVRELDEVGQHGAEHEGRPRLNAVGDDRMAEVVHRTRRPRWFMAAPRSMQTQMLGAKATLPATVARTAALSPRVRAVTLRIPDDAGSGYVWHAGQHVAVWLEESGEGSRPRYYSFASTPS